MFRKNPSELIIMQFLKITKCRLSITSFAFLEVSSENFPQTLPSPPPPRIINTIFVAFIMGVISCCCSLQSQLWVEAAVFPLLCPLVNNEFCQTNCTFGGAVTLSFLILKLGLFVVLVPPAIEQYCCVLGKGDWDLFIIFVGLFPLVGLGSLTQWTAKKTSAHSKLDWLTQR